MNALDLILEHAEGFRGMPYHDSGGVLTVGYGTTFPLTQAEGEALLHERLKPTQALIQRLVTVQLNVNQFDALTSFVYNIGETAFEESTLLKKLNAGDYGAVPGEMMRWIYDHHHRPVLRNRRQAEVALWSTPV